MRLVVVFSDIIFSATEKIILQVQQRQPSFSLISVLHYKNYYYLFLFPVFELLYFIYYYYYFQAHIEDCSGRIVDKIDAASKEQEQRIAAMLTMAVAVTVAVLE